jgi:hypothetical protein
VVRGSGPHDTEPVLIESRRTDRPVLRIASARDSQPGIPVVVLGYDSTGWVEKHRLDWSTHLRSGGSTFLEADIEPQRGVGGAHLVNLHDKVVGVVLPFHQSPLRLLPASDVLRAARSRRAG